MGLEAESKATMVSALYLCNVVQDEQWKSKIRVFQTPDGSLGWVRSEIKRGLMSWSSFTTGENSYDLLVMQDGVRTMSIRPRIILESMVGFKELFADQCSLSIIIKVRHVLEVTC